MEADVYVRIKQKDKRIENWHFSLCESDMILDVLNEVSRKGATFSEITQSQFSDGISDDYMRVAVHADLYEVNDGLGDNLGYVEHYTVNKISVFKKLFGT